MADITPAQIRAYYSSTELPQIGSYADSTSGNASLQRIIDQAYLLSDTSEAATYAVIAHLIVLAGANAAHMDGGAGEIVTENVGGLSQTIMVQARNNRESFFSTTPYGRLALQLENRTPSVALSMHVRGMRR